MVIRLAGRMYGLGSILLIAALLRLVGLDWGDGHPIHPDERHVVNMVTGLSWQDPNPHNFAYGSLPLYMTRAATRVVASLVGPSAETYQSTFLIGRALALLACLGTIALVYGLGRRLGGRPVGRLAALFLALAVLHIQMAHFCTVEALLVFMVTLAFWAALGIAESGRVVNYLLAGVLAGAAVATKLSALPLAAVLVVAHILQLWRRGRILDWSWLLLGLSLIAAYASFYVCEPFAFAQWPLPMDYVRSVAMQPWKIEFWEGFGHALFSADFLRDFWEQSSMVRGISQPIYVAVYENTTPYLYQVEQLLKWGMGPPLGIACLAGTLAMVFDALKGIGRSGGTNDSQSQTQTVMLMILLLSWLLPNCFIVGGFKVKFLRYLAPLIPFFCLAAAKFLYDLMASSDTRRAWVGTWATRVVLIYSAVYSLAYANLFLSPHTHVQASQWYADNASAGAKVLQEHWDESLPYSLPTTPGFTGVELPSYDPDSSSKTEILSKRLAESDFLICSSDRIYGTILKWQDRWPQTSRFYKLVFNGDLGYELAARFSSPPRLLGLTFDDAAADESFLNYDHPNVLVFRNQRRLDAETIAKRIEEPSPKLDPLSLEQSLELIPEAQGSAGAGNLSQALVWWVVVSGLGWLVFPLCFGALKSLPDHGFGASKTLGTLALAYLGWLGAMLGWTTFTRSWLVAFTILLGFVSYAAWQRQKAQLRTFLQHNLRLIVCWELCFLVVGATFLTIRAYNPEIYWGEKPMDFSFLNSFLRAERFPPEEPWFAGARLNYYYFGFVMVAAAGKLTQTTPGVLYNLALATIPAQVFVLTLGISQVFSRRLWFCVLGGVFAVFLGNLAWPILEAPELFNTVLAAKNSLFSTLGLPLSPPLVEAVRTPFQVFWDSSRVIPGAAIEEFPLWTFVFADLHAHMMAMPACLLTLACCIALVRRREPGDPIELGTAALCSLSIGSLFVTNAWDFISYMLVLGGLFTGVELARSRWHGVVEAVREIAGSVTLGGAAALVVGVAGLGMFYPYFEVFHAGSTYHGINRDGFVRLANILVLFGQFLWIHVTSLLMVHRSARGGIGDRTHATLLRATLLLGVAAIGVILFEVDEKPYVTAGFCGLLAAIAAWTALRGEPRRPFAVGWMLLCMGALLIAVADLFTMADRMNTIFKFYNAAWYLLAISAAACFYRALLAIWDTISDPIRTRYGRPYLLGVLVWFLVTTLLFAVSVWSVVIVTRGVVSEERVPSVRPTLDGTAYLRLKFPDDAVGIEWLNRNVVGPATVLEAWGPSYQDFTRICMHTGLSTVLGWDYHVLQRGQSDAEIRQRQRDIATMYRSSDPIEITGLLQKYGVDYIFVGAMEAQAYGTEVLEHFGTIPDLQLVFSRGATRIYRVGQGAAVPVLLAESVKQGSHGARTMLIAPSSAAPDPIAAMGMLPGDRLALLRRKTGTIEVFDRLGRHQKSLEALLGSQDVSLQSFAVRSTGHIVGIDPWKQRIVDIDVDSDRFDLHALPAEIRLPSAVVVDGAGETWVADLGRSRVIRLSTPPLEISASDEGPLSLPVALAFSRDVGVLVLCAGDRSVYRLEENGKAVRMFQLPNAPHSELDLQASIVVEPSRTILVTDPTAGQIYRYDPEIGVDPLSDVPSVPSGIAVDDAGNIYIGDALRGGVQVIRKQRSYNAFLAGQGDEPGQMNQPRGIAINADGTFWVADFDNHRIQKFRRDGTFVLTSGKKGNGDGEFEQPCDVAAIPDGGVAVADTWNHRVQILNSRGKFVRAFGEFYGPRGIALGSDGLLYITDTGNALVKVFTLEGRLEREWGGRGNQPGQFDGPVGIATGDDRVYVADTNNGRVQIFSFAGTFVAQISVPSWIGQGAEAHLALDEHGHLLATIPSEQRVVWLDAERGEVGTIRPEQTGGRRLQGPTGLDCLTGQILISDTWNHRMERVMNPFP